MANSAARSPFTSSAKDARRLSEIRHGSCHPRHLRMVASYQYLADTAAVAILLWDGWLPPSIKQIIAEGVGTSENARDLAVWLAGMHDLRKVSPAFAVQVRALATSMQAQGLTIPRSIEGTEERRIVRHEIVSHLVVSDWLQRRHGYDEALAKKLGSVLAAHLGRPPGPVAVQRTAEDAPLSGDGPWAQTRLRSWSP